jgi:AraC family transcriptional regulator, transcriptional activator of the genes for pyochelin and ferripyochelin receptors
VRQKKPCKGSSVIGGACPHCMRLKNCVTINHSDFVPGVDSTVTTTGGNLLFDLDWGRTEIKAVQLPNIMITDVRSVLNRNVHVRHEEDRECSTINSCFSLNGNVDSDFHGLRDPLGLQSRTQNFIYKPILNDHHYIPASDEQWRMFHYQVEVDYFLQLLDMDEDWSDDLRERILKKEVVTGPTEMMPITGAMFRCINEILNCHLTGSLRNIVIEAKILELIAYQLEQSQQYKATVNTSSVCRTERDKFHGLKDYLDLTFHEEHSLRSLAKMFCLNEFKLKKGFREMFGQTVFGYIHSLRMREAKMLIKEKGLNVSQVATRTGYKNPNHFSTAFKKEFGLSPSAMCR